MDCYDELIKELRDTSHLDALREVCADVIERLIKERDTAIADINEYASCDYCKHSNSECEAYWNMGECGLHGLCGGDKFEWRGIMGGEIW